MRSATEMHTCTRCGITRTIRAGREQQTLCRDCKAVLSTEERHEWTRVHTAPEPDTHTLTAEQRADAYLARLTADPKRVYRLLDEEFKPTLKTIRNREYDARTEQLRHLIHNPESRNA